MKTLVFIFCLFLLLCCQKSITLNEPQTTSDSPNNNVLKYSISDDLTVNPEFDVNVYLLAEGLSDPEGAVFYPPSKGLLVNESLESKIVDLNRHGMISDFASIQFSNPCLVDLLYAPNKGVFVTSLFDGKIFNINKRGIVEEYVNGLSMPLFMELDNKKNIYVSELTNNSIIKIDESKNISMVVDFADYHYRYSPRGIAFDHKDNLFVLSGRENEIMCFDIENKTEFPIIASASNVVAKLNEANNAQDLTIGLGGNIFVIDYYNIWMVEMNGTQATDVSIFVSGLVGPFNTIHSNSSGDLIVTDYGAGKVYGISKTVFAIN